MALRLENSIVRGEISNETRGRVTGRIWLLGRTDPVELDLIGDVLRDIAGCTLKFENPVPRLDPDDMILAQVQTGMAGELTASRKARIPSVDDEELMRRFEAGEPVPCTVANCLHLEWFSRSNGRVVIESGHFLFEVGAPAWSMTAEEEKVQRDLSQMNFHRWIDEMIGGSIEEDEDEDLLEEEDEEDDDVQNEVAPPLDEFEWEQELRDADRRAEAYGEAFDRYRDHPDRERLIAEAMGWDMDQVEEFRSEWEDVSDSLQPQDPEEILEHAASFTTDEQEMHHPLSRRAMNFALKLQRDAESRGMLAEGMRESPVLSVIVNVIALGGKLAAALDPTLEGIDQEAGFVIAMLKRAQIPLNEALHALSSLDLDQQSKDIQLWITLCRSELFDLRKDILDLMKDLRRQ